MPYRIEIVEGFLKIRFWGRISVEELQAYLAELSEVESKMNPVLNRLTDVSETTEIDLHFEVMDQLANLRIAVTFKNHFKSAFVAPTPLQFGLCRMFQSLNHNPNIHIQIFRNLESAIEWIKEP